MFSKFIKRPVFAIVISVVIAFLGYLSIRTLPTSQFPEIAPPRVIVTVAYPGASAEVLVQTTLIPLEQAIELQYQTIFLVSQYQSHNQFLRPDNHRI